MCKIQMLLILCECATPDTWGHHVILVVCVQLIYSIEGCVLSVISPTKSSLNHAVCFTHGHCFLLLKG